MNITIITTENKRLYPAVIYDDKHANSILNIDDIYNLLYKNKSIKVISNQYDQYGNALKFFDGNLVKNDIKAIFASDDYDFSGDLSEVMSLSEAAEKWGLSNGSTIRKSIERGKFRENEIKHSGSVWLITYSAMERVFGKVKNEENECILYDDFNLTKDYYEFAENYCETEKYINVNLKNEEVSKIYAKEMIMKGLNSLKNNKKVIIKKSWSNEVIQIINTEEEYYSYIKSFYSKRNMSMELIEGLLIGLKSNKK